ncbi:MAG: hypothetical protein J6A16_03960 [Oscillospiraceae bacterium]|nr:hypothetical protein [Oscillospiraceae bacterium]
MTAYPYQVTALTHNRRYPTYQLHAQAINDTLPPQTVMNICVLETMSWLRRRLSKYSDIPAEIDLPEPEDYSGFDAGSLRSFHLNIGCTIDVVYSEQERLWAFCLEEADAGANIGAMNERAPVNGRKFETNIAFRINNDGCVEVGVQTICSEPDNTTAYCEVFRPSVVKALYRNKNVGLRHILNVTDSPIIIESAKDFQRVKDAAADPIRELPLVLITKPAAVRKNKFAEIDVPEFDINSSLRSCFNTDNSFIKRELKIDLEALGIENKLIARTVITKESADSNAPEIDETEPEMIVPETVDYEKLASSLAAFAFVCSVSDSCFESVQTALCRELSKGDILILYKGSMSEIVPFREISSDIRSAEKLLKSGITEYPKRRSIDWGDILFTADARLLDLQQRRQERLSHHDEIELMKTEISELSYKLKNAEELVRGMSSSEDENRLLRKKNSALERELIDCRSELAEKTSAFQADMERCKTILPRLEFYREKSRAAAIFPTEKDDIVAWVERSFSDTIILHKNAAASLKKYTRPLLTHILCDGLYFLNGYALYRQGRISETELAFYAEEYGWEVQGCGKEALKMFADDYSVTIDGQSQLLKYHIKYGVNPTNWVRIYFFYDKQTERVIVGYMPDHLPTISDKT